MASEKFCLRWNDFESNISVAFRELREEKDFFDVTLACDDSQVQAHKVILSACSPFFRNILRRNPHQHPLLYLKGVKYKELLSVLNFMYQGEVNVAQEELNSFLAVAEDLRVKGLTQNNSTSSASPKRPPSPKIARPPPPPERDPVPPPKRPRPAPQILPAAPAYHHQEDDDIQEVQPIVKSEPVAPPAEPQQPPHYAESQQGGTVALDDDSYADESYDYGEYGDGGYDDGSGMIDPNTGLPIQGAGGADGNKGLEEAIRSRLTKLDTGVWVCHSCEFTSKSKQRAYEHVEARHLTTGGYSCPLCQKFCPTSSSLRNHNDRHHKQNKKSFLQK